MLTGSADWTAGEAFTYAKNLNAAEILRRLTFLGDPAIRIKRPVTSIIEDRSKRLPADFALEQNFPNPFNPSTTIQYSLKKASDVSLIIFNTLGQQAAILVNGKIEAGHHEVHFDGSHLASGLYFCRMQAGSFIGTIKLILIK
jgi:hypothetical protein